MSPMTYLFRLVVLSLLWLPGILRSSLAEIPRTYPLSETPLLAFSEPVLPRQEAVKALLPGMSELWVAALQGKESDLRYQAAVAIARAHEDGYRDMSDAVEPLMQALQVENQSADVKVQIARALVSIDARQSAEVLQKHLGEQRHFDMLVEPALARWKTASMLPTWRKRLLSKEVSPYQLRLAVECVGLSGDVEATDSLLKIVTRNSDHALRLIAASSATAVAASGLDDVARELIGRADSRDAMAASVDRVAAVTLLASSVTSESPQLLLMVDCPDNTAAALAWRQLLEAKAGALESRIETGLKHSDARVRELAVKAAMTFPSADRVRLLGLALDDTHPPVRLAARTALLDPIVQERFEMVAHKAVTEALKSSSWRGLEQAAFCAGSAMVRPTAERLVELIRHPRPEVAVAAAYALRQLSVPQTLPPMFEYASEISPRITEGQAPRHFEAVLTYLFESFGTMQYRPADELLRSWFPRTFTLVPLEYPRAAAIDAFGRLHADSADEEIARVFLARLTDPGTLPPESDSARYAAAIAIRRVNCKAFASELRALPAGSLEVVQAVNWTLHHLAGDALITPPQIESTGTDWFLVPFRR